MSACLTRHVRAIRVGSARFNTRALSSSAHHAATVQREPTRPSVKTRIPGPQTERIVKDLDGVFDTRSLKMIVDYKKSSGN